MTALCNAAEHTAGSSAALEGPASSTHLSDDDGYGEDFEDELQGLQAAFNVQTYGKSKVQSQWRDGIKFITKNVALLRGVGLC